MNAHKLIAIALAALLLTAGAAAATPGQSPTNDSTTMADDHAPDDGPDADENSADTDGNETDATPDENASDAPPTEMPEQVPNHVTQIHDLIREKLAGNMTGQELGEAISGLVGNTDESQADASQADDDGAQAETSDESASAARENGQADASAGGVGGVPQQAADHVSAIHDAIVAFLDGSGDNPGDAVGGAASG